jgi:hypothetical protein
MAVYARSRPVPRLDAQGNLVMSPADWVALKAGADLAQLGWPDSLVTRVADKLEYAAGLPAQFAMRVYVEGDDA